MNVLKKLINETEKKKIHTISVTQQMLSSLSALAQGAICAKFKFVPIIGRSELKHFNIFIFIFT